MLDHDDSHESNDEEMLRIRMLSNDIRQSPIDEARVVGEDEHEGEQDVCNHIAQFLILRVDSYF